MSMYFSTISEFRKMLTNLDGWLTKSEDFAKQKNEFDANVLLTMRLAPDQYELVKQIQVACDTAKFTAARFAGKEAPKHPDTEKTIGELHTRIHAVAEYLGGFTAKDFEGADTRKIDLPWAPTKYALGADYLVEMAIPNFYFHITHAYAILRQAGVNLGKMDYMGAVTLKDK